MLLFCGLIDRLTNNDESCPWRFGKDFDIILTDAAVFVD
jgi:hypothetical protein